MIKRAIKRLAASPPGWALGALARPAGVTVLMYHRVTGAGEPFHGIALDAFRAQMAWLARHCEPIHPDALADRLARPSRRRPAVLVTFDDGYRDYHDNAWPVLRELRIPAVVFLATSFMGTSRMIWTDEVWDAFHRTRRAEVEFPWDGARHALAGDGARRRAESAAKRYLKAIPDAERVRCQAALCERLGVDPGDGHHGRQMLSWDEVRATREGTVYGGHTHTHPILSQLPAAAADREIALCAEHITRELGEAPRTFAYPNGRAQDFNADNRASLQRHGFELAFSTIEGINGRGTDRYAILRQPTGAPTVADFAWLVGGR